MTVNFAGHLYNDAGTAISGASVKLLETGTTTQEGSTVTTGSAGEWAFTESDQDRYDVEITSGSSVRRIRWDDQISLKELDVRNNTGATTPAATFTNIHDAVANQVAVFSGANSTRADNDEIYLSFKLADSAGNLDEFARMTAVATDVTSGSEDGQIEFDVIKAGTLTKVWTITSSTGAAMSFDMNVDALTIGSGADTDVSLTFDANSADGVITWMEDEDYFKFSDEILMNSTEKILFGDTATFIHQSSDGVMTVDGEATIDLNASTAVLVSNDLKLNSDSAVLGFGADNDTTLTHTDGTGLTLNSTNKLTFGDTGTFIHQSSDGVLTITSDTTVDINGAVAFDGAITGATNITLSGELDAATLDLSSSADIAGDLVLSGGADGALQFTNAGENSIKIPDNQASALIIEEANNAYITFVTTNSSEAITVAKATTFSAGIADAGTIAAGTWNGTDVGVAYGGTGASSLTDGGVLLGSGTGAITAMAVLADSEMIVGDGTTDPVAESGATLRTSIGVGTGDSPQFTDLTLTDDLTLNSDSSVFNMGAGSDFKITHDGSTGATLTGNPITITSATAATWSTSGGDLTLSPADDLILTPASLEVVVGHTASHGQLLGTGGWTPAFQVNQTSNGGVSITQWNTTNSYAPKLWLSKSGHGTAGSHTVVADNEILGEIIFSGSDGTSAFLNAAMIRVQVNGTPLDDSTDMPGEILFLTTPDGASVPTEKMKIDQAGDVTGTHGNYHVSSDARLKENVSTIPHALAKVMAMRGVNFTWIDTDEKGSDLQMGLIAQEVEAVVPEVVHTQLDTEAQIKSVEYPFLVGLLVESIKELERRVEQLEQEA